MTGLSFSIPFFLHELGVAFSYIPVVMLLSVLPMAGGLVLGTLIALARIYKVPVVSRAGQAYIVVVRSIPILLQMFLVYYLVRGLYAMVGASPSDINKTVVVIGVFALGSVPFLSENIRSALLSVEKGQYEAGVSVGMSSFAVFRYIVLPQSLPVAIPVLGSSFIVMIKGSSAAYLLGVVEMLQAATMEVSGNYRYLEAYCATAMIYWGLSFLAERLTFICERRVSLHTRGGLG
jgi:His/Glu/Gln/Arg/opine family amino acid ABC transporter permease subunit